SSSGLKSRCSTPRWSWLSFLSALWWALERRPLAFVPDKVQVVDVALVTLVKADLVLRPVVLELPVRWRGDNKVYRPVCEEVHLSAVAVDYGVVALQGAVGCLGFIVGGAVLDA
ncbi:MAG: hypothetical protein WCK85_12745, partial [Chlorobium sp.]